MILSFPGSWKTGNGFCQPRVHTVRDRTSARRARFLPITVWTSGWHNHFRFFIFLEEAFSVIYSWKNDNLDSFLLFILTIFFQLQQKIVKWKCMKLNHSNKSKNLQVVIKIKTKQTTRRFLFVFCHKTSNNLIFMANNFISKLLTIIGSVTLFWNLMGYNIFSLICNITGSMVPLLKIVRINTIC